MKRANFNLSKEKLLTCDFGTLVPVLCEECLPGDIIQCSTELFSRFTALIAPVMQRVQAKIEYFFVPNRILWDSWKDFITDSQATTIPYLALGASMDPYLKKHSLADYLGLPVIVTDPDDPEGTISPSYTTIDNALPFIAYQRIWFDWYADQNLQSTAINQLSDQDGQFNRGGGSKNPAYYAVLRQRAFPRDYFTSALPWAQKGSPVRLPLYYPNGQFNLTTDKSAGDLVAAGYNVKYDNASGTTVKFRAGSPQNLVAGPTIEEVRSANALQRWLEKNARWGTRYIEQIAAHFGVRVPDYRLDRSEFLGSSKHNVIISEVLQQSQSTNDSALGEQAGHGVTAGVAGCRRYKVDEHGYFFAILSFVPRASYCEGVPRLFKKKTYLDFAFPEFDRLGEQPIMLTEVDGYTSGINDTVFGYQPRYAEYKQSYNTFHGDFRDSLSYWHLGRIFDANHQPALNESFITIDGGQDSGWTNRIFATQDVGTQHILVQLYHHLRMKRPLGRNVPSL